MSSTVTCYMHPDVLSSTMPCTRNCITEENGADLCLIFRRGATKRWRLFLRMEYTDFVQRGNTLQMHVEFSITDKNYTISRVTPEFVINGAVFQIKSTTNLITYHANIFVKFFKLLPDADNLNYTIKFTSKKFSIIDMNFISNKEAWHLIHVSKERHLAFDVTVNMDITPNCNSFAPLHEDVELTDFELRGEDGAIRVHKAVLAAASPVLRRMLCGTWKETTEGHIVVSGTSRKTLQDFKNFVYLRMLPDMELEQLLVLSSLYMMPEMQQKCTDKLLQSLTTENAFDLLEFAVKNKVTRLTLSILELVQNKVVKVENIREQALRLDND